MDNVYKVIFEEGEDEGLLYGISLVDAPANQFEFLKFKKLDEIKFAEEKEKRLLTGVVLIPNQRIARRTKERGDFEVFFEKETIEKLSQAFFENSFQKNNWFNHDESKKIQSTVVESWIISNENIDKAVALGFKDLPVGTWMITMKLNQEDWDKYVKGGKVKGFSIDSLLPIEKILFSEIETNKQTINLQEKIQEDMKSYLKEFLKFMESKKEDIKMIDIQKGEQTLTVESLEVGQVVRTEDGLFESDSFIEGDNVYFTNDKGEITSVEPNEDVSETETEPVDAKKEDEKVDAKDEEDDEKISLEESKDELFKMIDEDEELKAVLLEKFEKTKEETIEMSLNLAKEDKEVSAKFKNLFSEEIEAKDKEILELKKQLEDTPNSGKPKAEIKMKSLKEETALEAINRIVNSK